MKDCERFPTGKFHLIEFTPNNDPKIPKRFVVVLYGKTCLTYCCNRVKPMAEAKSHFWRLIGAA